ncbi:MAG: AAA family ATPase [Anaerolineae bacterium]|nr:AAA family ATPase [Anaerolineae bacterium]
MLLPERQQQQIIRDFVDGLEPPQDDIKHLADPYDWLYDYLGDTDNTDRRYVLLSQLVHQDNEWRDVVESILNLTPGEKERFKTIQQVGSERPPTTWLWENWVPKGYLSMLAGYPSAGKTYFALDFIRLIAMGLPAPDDELFVDLTTKNVIFVDGEDFAAEAWRRLSAWEFDPNKMFVYEKPKDEMIDFTCATHKDDLRQMCYTLKPDLIVVDSLSTVSPNGENSVEDVRTLLSFLISVAQDYNCAVCLLHHLSKPKKGSNPRLTMHDLRGSGHIVAMSRSIIGLDSLNLGTDDPNGPKIIKSLKNNLSKIPFPIRLDFEPNKTEPKLADLRYSTMDLFSRPEEIKSESQRCAEWLTELLEEGEMSYIDILAEADQEGFSRYLVDKARESLGGSIIDTKGSGATGNKWALVEHVDGDDPQLLTLTDTCARWLLSLLQEHGELPLKDIRESGEERGFKINVILKARKKLGLQVSDTHGARVKGNKWTLSPWLEEEAEKKLL